VDGEIGDLIPRSATGDKLPLGVDLGRAFLYARYEAELTDKGLEGLGVRGVDPRKVQALDSVENMPQLATIGKALASQVDVTDFGSFLGAPIYERLNTDAD
jgi:hypothetical protein